MLMAVGALCAGTVKTLAAWEGSGCGWVFGQSLWVATHAYTGLPDSLVRVIAVGSMLIPRPAQILCVVLVVVWMNTVPTGDSVQALVSFEKKR